MSGVPTEKPDPCFPTRSQHDKRADAGGATAPQTSLAQQELPEGSDGKAGRARKRGRRDAGEKGKKQAMRTKNLDSEAPSDEKISTRTPMIAPPADAADVLTNALSQAFQTSLMMMIAPSASAAGVWTNAVSALTQALQGSAINLNVPLEHHKTQAQCGDTKETKDRNTSKISRPSELERTFKIFVKYLDGRTFTLYVNSDNTFGDISRQLQERGGGLPAAFLLNGKPLEPHKTLAQYGFTRETSDGMTFYQPTRVVFLGTTFFAC